MTSIRPSDVPDLVETVSQAVATGQPFEIVGGGTKRTLGRPSVADHRLDLGAFDSVVDYDPSELVITAQAAAPLAAIEAQLRAQGQMLAFEPPDWRGLLASEGEPTLGGAIACNLSGPRRVRAGAARDHLLGFSAVNGWGEAWKAGGRVVKNVTGYDMGKLQAGAYGTLSVLTEISVKVLPRPETSATLVLWGLADDVAIPLLATALNSPHEVTAAAHLPPSASGRCGVDGTAGATAAMTAIRLEGHRPSVNYRVAALRDLLGGADRLGDRDSDDLWQAIGAVGSLIADAGRVVWRICPTPSAAPALLGRVRASLASAEGFYDWGGGLLWLALDGAEAGTDCGAATVRAAVAAAGGHATLIRAPASVRATVSVFEPAGASRAALARRVKASFDPHAILNPGRMQEGL